MTATTTWAGLGVLACFAGATVVGVVLGRLWSTSRRPDPGWVRYHNHPAVPGVVQTVHAGIVGPHVRHCDHHRDSGMLLVEFADATRLLLDDDLEPVPTVSSPPWQRLSFGRGLGTTQVTYGPTGTAAPGAA